MPTRWTEHALQFDCGGVTLTGVVAAPAAPAEVGVVIVVGGPQYRAGSHRQFVLLSRALAAAGVAALRFDLRGMGDSAGIRTDFRAADDDIASAIDALSRVLPSVRRVVLWGLCDGATACALYRAADTRVTGCVLVNPWVRSSTTAAKTRLASYYARRVLDLRFWRKLVRGRVEVAASAGGVWSTWRESRPGSGGHEAPSESLAAQLVNGLERAARPRLVVLSGRDEVADEFRLIAARDARLGALLRDGATERVEVPEANHTFSSARLRGRLAELTLDWLQHRAGAARGEPAPAAFAHGGA